MPLADQRTGAIYDVGDRLQLECEFRDSTDILVNPGTVTASVKKPDGTTASLSTTNPSTGVFRALVTLDQEGKWYYRFVGTSPVEQASERWFEVRDSAF